MFYWSSRDVHVVLSDKEEMSLVRELAKEDISDVIGYDTRVETRKKYEKLIFSYLNKSLKEDRVKFINKYVNRSLDGDQVHDLLRGYLSRYGQLTKIATFGKFISDSPDPDIFGTKQIINDLLGVSEDNPFYYITFVNRTWLPWPKYEFNNYISIPKNTVRKLFGAVTNFSILTDKLLLSFKEKNYSIKVLQ